ncbi:MAG: hypothetical protein LBS64_04250 [Spirochaetaceae bacterium]|jgi:hypothetical protein|nr:hypothetical protein [Spirochaetaceae bacterium]
MAVLQKDYTAIRDSVKTEIDALPGELLALVRDFVLFQKYRNVLTEDDSTYLQSIPGMAAAIREGRDTPVSQCVPLSGVWPDV